MTEKVEHQLLSYQKFCDEEYVLVGPDPEEIKQLSTDNILNTRFINFPGMGVYFDFWINHFMPQCKNINHRSLHHAGEMNSIEGAILMVVGGLGISVFPSHCVDQYLQDGRLFAYECPNTAPLLNSIHIVSRIDPPQPKRVTTVIDWFMDMKSEH